MTPEEISARLNELYEQAAHGTHRSDIQAAFEYGVTCGADSAMQDLKKLRSDLRETLCRCGHAVRLHAVAGQCLVDDCDCAAYSRAATFPAQNPELDRLIRQGAQAIQAGLNLQIRENKRKRTKRPLNVLSDAEREIAHCVAMALEQARMPWKRFLGVK